MGLARNILRGPQASLLLAVRNTLQDRKRLLAAVSGISFSLVLIFMQLGFLGGARIAATLLYQFMDFDTVIVSDEYRSLASSGRFDKSRMLQAAVTPGVAKTAILNIRNASWENTETEESCSLMIIGVDQDPDFVSNPAMRAGLPSLATRDHVMLDILSHRDYGAKDVGTRARVNTVDIEVVSHFTLGMIFYSEGCMAVSNDTFSHLTGLPSRSISFGLLKATPGVTPEELRERLAAALPDDVFVFTRDQLIHQEQEYFISVKPIGIIFRTGVLVAFLVGMVILYQVMSTEITNRLTEYATMKAMGFGHWFIYQTGLMQALCYTLLSYAPALVISYFVFRLVNWASHLPMELTGQRCALVFVLALAMCGVSGILALRKVRTADPTELF